MQHSVLLRGLLFYIWVSNGREVVCSSDHGQTSLTSQSSESQNSSNSGGNGLRPYPSQDGSGLEGSNHFGGGSSNNQNSANGENAQARGDNSKRAEYIDDGLKKVMFIIGGFVLCAIVVLSILGFSVGYIMKRFKNDPASRRYNRTSLML